LNKNASAYSDPTPVTAVNYSNGATTINITTQRTTLNYDTHRDVRPSAVILNVVAPLVGSARCFDNNLALFLPRSAKLKLGGLGSTKTGGF